MQKKRAFHSFRKSRAEKGFERERYVRRDERAWSRSLRSEICVSFCSGDVDSRDTVPLDASCLMNGLFG